MFYCTKAHPFFSSLFMQNKKLKTERKLCVINNDWSKQKFDSLIQESISFIYAVLNRNIL